MPSFCLTGDPVGQQDEKLQLTIRYGEGDDELQINRESLYFPRIKEAREGTPNGGKRACDLIARAPTVRLQQPSPRNRLNSARHRRPQSSTSRMPQTDAEATKSGDPKANRFVGSSSGDQTPSSADALAIQPQISVHVSKSEVKSGEQGSNNQAGRDDPETASLVCPRSPVRESQPTKPQGQQKKVAVVNLEQVELTNNPDVSRNNKMELSLQDIKNFRMNKDKEKIRPFSARIVKRVEWKGKDLSDVRASRANAIRVQGSCIKSNAKDMPTQGSTARAAPARGAIESSTEEEVLSCEEEGDISSEKSRSRSLGSSDSFFEVDVAEPLLLDCERAKLLDGTVDQEEVSSPNSLDFFGSVEYQYLIPQDQSLDTSIFPDDKKSERPSQCKVGKLEGGRERGKSAAFQDIALPDIKYNLVSDETKDNPVEQEDHLEDSKWDHGRSRSPSSNHRSPSAANMESPSHAPFIGLDDPILSQVLQDAAQLTSGNNHVSELEFDMEGNGDMEGDVDMADETSHGRAVIHCTECGNRMLLDDSFFETKPVIVFKYSNFDAMNIDQSERNGQDMQAHTRGTDTSFEERLESICSSMETQINNILFRLSSLQEAQQPPKHANGRSS